MAKRAAETAQIEINNLAELNVLHLLFFSPSSIVIINVLSQYKTLCFLSWYCVRNS